MDRKYEIIRQETVNGRILNRIVAINDIPGVCKAGYVGGLIEKEDNLSHYGRCWIFPNAMVYDNAMVAEDALLFGFSMVFDNAMVSDAAQVCDMARVYGNARVLGNSRVYDKATVFGNSRIEDHAKINDTANVFGNANVSEFALLYGEAEVFENGRVYGNAWVGDKAKVYGSGKVKGHAKAIHEAEVFGAGVVEGNAVLVEKAKVYGLGVVRYGVLDCDMFSSIRKLVSLSLNVYPNPMTGTYILYKRVNKVNDGVYRSIYYPEFLYVDGEVVEVEVDEDVNVSCGKGIHISTPTHLETGDTLIAVEVHVKDIVTCLGGKVRCRKIRVLGEVKF